MSFGLRLYLWPLALSFCGGESNLSLKFASTKIVLALCCWTGKSTECATSKCMFTMGSIKKTFWIECAALGISNYYYYWDDFSNSEVLCDNLLRYANWNMNKYQKQ